MEINLMQCRRSRLRLLSRNGFFSDWKHCW